MSILPSRLNATFIYLRWILIFSLLISEIISLTALFDFNVTTLNESPNILIQLSSHASVILKLAVSFVAAFLLLISPRIQEIIHDLKKVNHPWRLWLVIQCLIFGIFVLYTAKILPSSSYVILPTSGISIHSDAKWFAGWFALGTLTLIPWLLALAPKFFWYRLCRQEFRAMLIALFAAVLVWLGVLITPAVGAPLADISIKFAHQILLWMNFDVTYNLDQKELGLQLFSIQISPGCSGYEGIIMIAVFMALYLWLFHKDLKFPQVLCLFPLGFLAIWLANIVRIVSMIIFGEYISPSIARGGLHSQAGWINFTLIALALITLSHHLFALKEPKQKNTLTTLAPEITLIMPLLVMMGALMFTSALSDGYEILYPLRITIVTLVLWHYRRAYRTMDWSVSWQAAIIGVLVFLIWILLEPTEVDSGNELQKSLLKLPGWLMTTWLIFRVIGSVLIIPIVEELAFRGYLLRQLVAEDFENVSPTHFTWFSFIVSSVLFGLLHGRWLAGILAGMAFALALYRRGKIGDAILAHVVANALIAFSVLVFGNWSLWA